MGLSADEAVVHVDAPAHTLSWFKPAVDPLLSRLLIEPDQTPLSVVESRVGVPAAPTLRSLSVLLLT